MWCAYVQVYKVVTVQQVNKVHKKSHIGLCGAPTCRCTRCSQCTRCTACGLCSVQTCSAPGVHLFKVYTGWWCSAPSYMFTRHSQCSKCASVQGVHQVGDVVCLPTCRWTRSLCRFTVSHHTLQELIGVLDCFGVINRFNLLGNRVSRSSLPNVKTRHYWYWDIEGHHAAEDWHELICLHKLDETGLLLKKR